ncbi:DUF4156 domain-containing protein [Endozoicomonas sp. Mp262]|uniref:DUF4156 domain-containing protein n=1 Tax=Endozoicomonas sp. Mp262 TaxID=2919499 RepID=UPI0021D9BA30
MKYIFAGLSMGMLTACSATKTAPGSERIELVNEAPNKAECQFLGEIAGSHVDA